MLLLKCDKLTGTNESIRMLNSKLNKVIMVLVSLRITPHPIYKIYCRENYETFKMYSLFLADCGNRLNSINSIICHNYL